jgi:hypothetical protein
MLLSEPVIDEGSPAALLVPDLYGLTEEDAAELLEAVGLEGAPTEEETDDAAPSTVLFQDPPAGSAVAPGDVVIYGVAIEPSPSPEVCNSTWNREMKGGGETLREPEGSFIHIEHWTQGNPERESLLPFTPNAKAYRVLRNVRGWLWAYPPNCTQAEVMRFIKDHIIIRKPIANNDGFIDWWKTGYIKRMTPDT